jgi:hypothetical protein
VGTSREFVQAIIQLHSNVGRNFEGKAQRTQALILYAGLLLGVWPRSKTCSELCKYLCPSISAEYIRESLPPELKETAKATDWSKNRRASPDAGVVPHTGSETPAINSVAPATPITLTIEPQKEVQLAPVDTTIPKLQELVITINDSVLLERIKQVERDTGFTKEEQVRLALKDYYGLYWNQPLDVQGYIDLINDSKIRNGFESSLEHLEETGESVAPAPTA